ncbi:MAG: FtsB family cell division protein [Pyrinomonadaceae bacterium]
MNKVAVTYWDNQAVSISAARTRARNVKQRENTTPQWFVYAVVVAITCLVCLTINLRTFSELNNEIVQFQKINTEVDQLSNENLALQEEIHNLKTDSNIIEREARKLGMSSANEKVLVPAN